MHIRIGHYSILAAWAHHLVAVLNQRSASIAHVCRCTDDFEGALAGAAGGFFSIQRQSPTFIKHARRYGDHHAAGGGGVPMFYQLNHKFPSPHRIASAITFTISRAPIR
jgi:hypothetical protein